MPLRYRAGAPLYGRTLQTVLAKRPCRVIVSANPGDQADGTAVGGRQAMPRGTRIALMAAPAPDEVYRGVTRLFAVIISASAIAIIAVTLANGGGPHVVRASDRARLHGARSRAPLPLDEDVGLIDPFRSGAERSPITRRWLGVPLLFAVAYSAVGFSLYFSLGLVADHGLGLTPLIFLGVGLVFLLNAMTYIEGEAMLPERGGSATFARAAFRNELVSFIAGWAILIDYVIVIALAAISVPHYLTPIWSGFTDASGEIVTAAR